MFSQKWFLSWFNNLKKKKYKYCWNQVEEEGAETTRGGMCIKLSSIYQNTTFLIKIIVY